MPVLECVVANLLVIVGALSIVRCFQWRGLVHAGVMAATWYFSQIVFSILFAGIILQSINASTVLVINLAMTGALLGIALRWGTPLSAARVEARWQEFARHMRGVYQCAWVFTIALLMLFEFVWMGFLGVIYPTYDYDGLAYHMVSVVTWLQTGNFSVTRLSVWSNVYPMDVETFYTWLVLFLHRGVLANTGQLFFALGGVLAVIGIGRLCGLGRPAALGAGGLFLLTPILIAQLTTNYVDVAFASLVLMSFYFALRYLQEPALSHLLFFGLAAGLTLGSKSSAISFLGADSVVLVGAFIYHRRTQLKAIKGTYVAAGISLVLVPVVLLGTFWYIRTWVTYANPVYPYSVILGHRTIFAGWGSVQALIMDPLTPAIVLHKPFFEQVAISWLNEPPHLNVQGSPYTYMYDQRLGGFGPQWILLEFPALIAYVAYAARNRRDILFAFLLPFFLCFLVQPAMWWTRYVLFFVAPGAIALAYFLGQLRPLIFRIALQAATVGLVLVSLYVSSAQGYFSISTVVGALSAVEHNTTAAYWFPQFAWVDTVIPGSHIGWVPSPNHWQVYPMFGSTLENRVFVIDATDQTGFMKQLRAYKVTYLYAEANTKQARWAGNDGAEFHLIDRTDSNRVYKVTLLATPSHALSH